MTLPVTLRPRDFSGTRHTYRQVPNRAFLFPFPVMDLLLALTETRLHQLLWTDELLAEWDRVRGRAPAQRRKRRVDHRRHP